MLLGGHCHYHFGSENGVVDTLDALRSYLKYSTHRHSIFRLYL